MNQEFLRILSDLARKYDNAPEGVEKEELKKIIDKAAKIIYGEIDIDDLNNEE
jgi:hypothetical protein